MYRSFFKQWTGHCRNDLISRMRDNGTIAVIISIPKKIADPSFYFYASKAIRRIDKVMYDP